MIINDINFNVDLDVILFDLQKELEELGIPLLQKIKPTVEDIMIQCPYHNNGQEKRPSAGIRKKDGLFHCLACGETHSLQEVITHCFGKYDDITGVYGLQWLLRHYAVVESEIRQDIPLNFSRNKEISTPSYVTESELDKYRYYHSYWTKRGITDEQLIELFDLGYDKDTQCITFPVRDKAGHCLFVARRSVITKYFNYPRGVEKPLYGLYEIEQIKKPWRVVTTDGEEHTGYYPDEIIVCESMLDALTCWQYGKYAVALNGLGNERQFKELRDLQCRMLILATDNDKAGMEARDRIKRNVNNKIIAEYILPEDKKDINELTYIEFTNLQKVF